MAHKESGTIAPADTYTLGEYVFRISRSYNEDEDATTITATCTKGSETAYRQKFFPGNVLIENWYVDANDTTADVYANIQIPGGEADSYTSDLVDYPLLKGELFATVTVISQNVTYGTGTVRVKDCDVISYGGTGSGSYYMGIKCSETEASLPATLTVASGKITNGVYSETPLYTTAGLAGSYTHLGLTAYYRWIGILDHDLSPNMYRTTININYPHKVDYNQADAAGKAAWTVLYGTPHYTELEEDNILIGRFEIDLHDAGGTGPDSDWEDPGDWNEDPETLLSMGVAGALSGRHNDPLNDKSYSYLPMDNEAEAYYGCGGEGGFGGGGGGGAASVIVYEFATDKANQKEVGAHTKRYGYGSGGGKGGKGGDGCIIIYYTVQE